LKPTINLIDQLKKKKVHIGYVNVVKETPFGGIFMDFYEQMFGEENKGLMSNTGITRILDRSDKNAQHFAIRGRSIALSVEDVALKFGLLALGVDLLQNRKCNKRRGFFKHYFGDI